jgi:cell division protein FtsA
VLDNYICALDIGSSKIAAVAAKVKARRLSEIFFETEPAKGIKKGIVVDSIDLVSALTKVFRNLKAKSRINIKSAYINLSGEDIVTKHSQAIIPLAERGNKVITLSDMDKVNEQARILASSLEEEIIYQAPSSYSIDSRGNIQNPLGLYSHKLEVDLYLVSVRLSTVQSLVRAVNQAGSEIKNLFLSGIGTSRAVFNSRFRNFTEGVNLLCDIGSDITEIVVFKDGLLRDVQILSLGGDDLTLELEERLKIPFELAEDVKRSHGMAGIDLSQIDENKEILVKKSDIYKPIKQKLVAEILTAKTEAICQKIKDSLDKKINLAHLNNFVVTGRTLLLGGFLEMLEGSLGIPLKLGRINNPDIISLAASEEALSGQKYLTYLTSLGMLSDVLRGTQPQNISMHPIGHSLLSKAINRVIEVYQEYF